MISVIPAACVELLRYRNRELGHRALSKEDVQKQIWLQLQPSFIELNPSRVKWHFDYFWMPAFDWWLMNTSRGPTYTCLMFAFDCISSHNIPDQISVGHGVHKGEVEYGSHDIHPHYMKRAVVGLAEYQCSYIASRKSIPRMVFPVEEFDKVQEEDIDELSRNLDKPAPSRDQLKEYSDVYGL